MNKRSIPVLLATCLAVFALACKSSPSAASVPCTCGTPQADIEGCAHSTCLAGETNPDNPDCVCGALSLPK
jgi:hypothetical protein